MGSIPDDAIKQIIDFNLLDELHISFYGPTEELYAKYQPPLSRAKTVENIQKFFNYRMKKGKAKPHITLHVLNVPEILIERLVKDNYHLGEENYLHYLLIGNHGTSYFS